MGTPALLPPALIQAIQIEARRAVLHYAPSRSELDALRRLVMAQFNRLTLAERADLALLLPALHELRPGGTWVLAEEIIGMAQVAQGDDALRVVCARFLARPVPAAALGKFLGRCIGLPVAGLFLERVEPDHRRGSVLYRVAGITL